MENTTHFRVFYNLLVLVVLFFLLVLNPFWFDQIFYPHFIIDGDIEPETLVTRAYNYRRWRIAQTIEKLGFNLCFFGLNSYGLLVKVYEFGFICWVGFNYCWIFYLMGHKPNCLFQLGFQYKYPTFLNVRILLMINENCRFCISLLSFLLFFGFLLPLGFFLFPALILLLVVPHHTSMQRR